MSLRIFVYGTLKQGLSNSHYLAGQQFVADARTQPAYRLVDCGGYPAMHAVEKNGLSIAGELWEITEECGARLDLLEDVAGGEYARALIKLLPPHAETESIAYLYLRDPSALRDAGDCWTDPKSH